MSNRNEVIRNAKPFIQSYLESDSGKAALKRAPFRGNDGKQVWRNAAIPVAFQRAVA